MNNTQTLEQLRSLRLTGMYDYYKQMLNMPAHEHPDAHQLIAMLAQSENLWRTNRKTERYIKQARFRYAAALESIDYHPDRYLDKTIVQALSDCSFIDRGENVLITGATGCGKSYMATALGQQACSLGYKSLYVSMPKLTEQVLSSRADASYQKLILRMAKPDVLILDDFGLSPVDQNMRLTLLQILEDRYESLASEKPEKGIEICYEHIDFIDILNENELVSPLYFSCCVENNLRLNDWFVLSREFVFEFKT